MQLTGRSHTCTIINGCNINNHELHFQTYRSFMASFDYQFSPYGHAKKAGISETFLLDILRDNSAADFGATRSFQTYPTTGILLDLLEHAVHVSTVTGPSTGKILKKWVDVLYPACRISRWDRLERRVRSLALPVQRKDTTEEYLNRIWKPRNTSPQNESMFERR